MARLTLTKPRGVIAAAALVQAVARIGDMAEHHYLEIKGPPDLESKVNKQKIAKFILGAANRMPEKAANAFEGCAVMIIGITAEGITGIPPIEILEISKVVQPFLGAEGPLWDIVRVSVDGSSNEVLVVIVEPPQLGQPPFICRDNGEGLRNGGIYIRADGATRDAIADEIVLLIKRGSAKKLEVSFDVEIIGKVESVVVEDSKTLEPYISSVRQSLLSAIDEYMPPSLSKQINPLFQAMGELPENRTEIKYKAEIDAWEKKLREEWPSAIKILAGHLLPSPLIRITNNTSTFFQDVELKIHLDGAIMGAEWYDWDDPSTLPDLELPSPPRRWGPRPNPTIEALSSIDLSRNFSLPNLGPPSRLDWNNSGSVDLTLDVGDLRPDSCVDYEESDLVLLLINAPGTTTIHGTWKITAEGFHEVFRGELELEVSDVIEFNDPLRILLRLEGSDSEENE